MGEMAIRADLESKQVAVTTAELTMAIERLRTGNKGAGTGAGSGADTGAINPENTGNLGNSLPSGTVTGTSTGTGAATVLPSDNNIGILPRTGIGTSTEQPLEPIGKVIAART